MISTASLLPLLHLIGLILGIGAATVKLVLLLACGADGASVSAYARVSKPITRLIILGLALMTLSGVGWLLLGYPFTPLLVAKLVLVAAIWALGPVIDNVVEPGFHKTAPRPGEEPSAGFVAARKRFLLVETLATSLFYCIILLWMLGRP